MDRRITMDESKAFTIVSALANGVNPLTGELFAFDSPYQAPDVIRALYSAVRALETVNRRSARVHASLGNAGKAWSEEEDRQLLAEFDRGRPIAELAQAHSRTRGGIQARLVRHGRLQAPLDPRPSLYRQAASSASSVQDRDLGS
jgi:hypothetical protein